MTTKTKAAPNGSGPAPEPDTLAQAIAYEEQIAAEADQIRGEQSEMTPLLFLQLLPLLRRPIPAGFIVSTEATTGKPYDSTGIKSLQVQIDRLDNVLTPLNWSWETRWSDDGKTADVTVHVWADGGERILVSRRARGGVNRGSTDGNVLKGSETNAAKLAFARLGVGHEVYLGAADFDPDVDPDAAKEQAKASTEDAPRKLPAEKVESLKKIIAEAGLDGFLEMKLRSFGVATLEDLTVDQGIELWEWVQSERSNG